MWTVPAAPGFAISVLEIVKRYPTTRRIAARIGWRQVGDARSCVQCGKVVEFLDQTIEQCQEQVAKREGFRIRDHSLIIYGDCARKNCPNQKS